MKTNQEEKEPNTSKTDLLGSQKFKLALLIFIVYISFIAYLLYNTGLKDDLIWTRMLFLFTGIEAITFAALGYVFGKDINRKRAENAEKNADDAKKKEEKANKEAEAAKEKAKKDIDLAKDKAQKEREKGITLSTAVKSLNFPSTDINEDFTTKSATGVNKMSNADYLFDLANQLYPKISDYVTVSFRYETENINDITINGDTESSAEGTYSGVPIYDNRFTIHANRKDELKDWTIKITNIIDSNGDPRKQLGGKLESSSATDYVKLENL